MCAVESRRFVGAVLFWLRRTPSERSAFLKRPRRRPPTLCVSFVKMRVQTLGSRFVPSGLRKVVKVAAGARAVGKGSIGAGTKDRASAGGRLGKAMGKPCSYAVVA